MVNKHQRQIIREKIRDLLLQKTWAEKRIYTNRSTALFESELPCILILTRDEAARKFTEAPRQLQRQLNVSIQAICRLQDDIDDYLDSLALQIEILINVNPFLDETVADVILTGTEVAVSSEGNMPIGSITLNYQVEYYQYVPDENDFNASAFEKAHIQLNNSEDLIELPKEL